MKQFLAKLVAPATESGNLSVGRIMLISCFTLAMIKWVKGIDIPDSQITILMTLLGYVLGTKVISGIKDTLTGINEAKKAVKGEE